MKPFFFFIILLFQLANTQAQTQNCLSGNNPNADFMLGRWQGNFEQYACGVNDKYAMQIDIYEVKGKKFSGYFVWKGGLGNMDHKTVLKGEIKKGKVFLYEVGLLEGVKGLIVVDGVYNSKLLSCEKMQGIWYLTKPNKICPSSKPLEKGGHYTLQKIKKHQVVKPIKERKIIVQHHIKVQLDSVTIKIWDHQQEDGDIVSLKVNNQVVVKEFMISKKPKEFKIGLKKGKNNLILHAINLGEIPPNTAAIAVYHKGEKIRQVVLKSTLNTSQALEIMVE